jgi:hypothetical protein
VDVRVAADAGAEDAWRRLSQLLGLDVLDEPLASAREATRASGAA